MPDVETPSRPDHLPNADQAQIDPRKLRDYALNTEHSSGRYKAAFFAQWAIRLPTGREWNVTFETNIYPNQLSQAMHRLTEVSTQ